MTEDQNTEALKKARTFSDNKDKIDGFYNGYVQATIELEKENAVLKGIKDVATLIRANNDTVTTLMQLNNMLVSRNQQLTKATELLRKLVLEVTGYEEIYGYDTCEPVQEAEQFLSEVEK